MKQPFLDLGALGSQPWTTVSHRHQEDGAPAGGASEGPGEETPSQTWAGPPAWPPELPHRPGQEAADPLRP